MSYTITSGGVPAQSGAEVHGLRSAAATQTTAADAWAKALSDPGFKVSLDEGMADVAAGRTYRVVRFAGKLYFVPNKNWPADGPQPDRLSRRTKLLIWLLSRLDRLVWG